MVNGVLVNILDAVHIMRMRDLNPRREVFFIYLMHRIFIGFCDAWGNPQFSGIKRMKSQNEFSSVFFEVIKELWLCILVIMDNVSDNFRI